MALQITNNNGIYELTGNITTKTAMAIKKHFEFLLGKTDTIILNLDKVESMDISGAQMLLNLYKKAVRLNKAFTIIGKENNGIKNAFSASKMKFIIKRDTI